jgi:hypothetical protein
VSSEPDRRPDPALLAGEDPETEHPEDVEHWIGVYTELLAGARRLRGIATEDDLRLDVELGRLRNRLAFWIERRADLRSAPSGGGVAGSVE